MFRNHLPATLIDPDRIRHPVLAAEHAGWAEAAMVHDKARRGLAAPQFDLVVETEATAMPASAGRTFAKRIAVIEHRILLLHDLDRRCLGNADRRAAVGDTVATGITAIATA